MKAGPVFLYSTPESEPRTISLPALTALRRFYAQEVNGTRPVSYYAYEHGRTLAMVRTGEIKIIR
jgi:hypothetical protein